MDDTRTDALLDSTLSKVNGAAGDVAVLVAEDDDAYLCRVAKAVEDDMLATAQRFLLADSTPIVGRERALLALVHELNRNIETSMALAGLVGDVQDGRERVKPDRLRQAAATAALESVLIRDQALAVLAPPAPILSTPTDNMKED